MNNIRLTTTKTAITLAAILGLQVNTIFAAESSGNNPAVPGKVTPEISIRGIAPITPVEATFEDAGLVMALLADVSALAPEVPAVADFEDAGTIHEGLFPSLTGPAIPAEAGFEDPV